MFTRYWKPATSTSPTLPDSFVATVRTIVEIARRDYGIMLADPDGLGEPIITPETIALNGPVEAMFLDNGTIGTADYSYESFNFPQADEYQCFCKTNRLPYDAVIHAILLAAGDHDLIASHHHDATDDDSTTRTGAAIYDRVLAEMARG